MREDLDRERRFMAKQWSKRESQIMAVVDSTVGIVGDLHGIPSRSPGSPALQPVNTAVPHLSLADPEARIGHRRTERQSNSFRLKMDD